MLVLQIRNQQHEMVYHRTQSVFGWSCGPPILKNTNIRELQPQVTTSLLFARLNVPFATSSNMDRHGGTESCAKKQVDTGNLKQPNKPESIPHWLRISNKKKHMNQKRSGKWVSFWAHPSSQLYVATHFCSKLRLGIKTAQQMLAKQGWKLLRSAKIC